MDTFNKMQTYNVACAISYQLTFKIPAFEIPVTIFDVSVQWSNLYCQPKILGEV